MPQGSDKTMDGKSIPNHIPPMHSQLPQNKMPNSVSSRRPSAQYPNAGHTVDPRFPNNPSYSTDVRNLGPQYDQFYKPNQDLTWSAPGSTQNQMANQKPYPSNEPPSGYNITSPEGQLPAAPYRLQQQQSVDQMNQQYQNQNRRPSASRPPMNQRPSQDWTSPAGVIRRQSVLALPTDDPQSSVYTDPSMASYARNELRTGTVHSEGPLDRSALNTESQGYRQAIDPQGYRQPLDAQGFRQAPQQQGYRQAPEQQMYRQPPMDQQGYRQTPDKQMYRQQAVDQPSYRAPGAEQDIINGDREPRAPGSRPSIDYFDHYKRPPSRDSSVDRFGRRSRQPSVEAAPPGSGSRAGSVAPQPMSTSRAGTPAGNGHLASGRGSFSRAPSREQPFEDSLLRKRTLGQEISPSPYQPKRTESLFVAQNPAPPPLAPAGGGGGGRKVCYVLTFFYSSIATVIVMPYSNDKL